MKLIKKIFASTFAASFTLPIYSQINKGFEDKVRIQSEPKNLIAENTTEGEDGTLKIFFTGTRSPREIKNVPASVNSINQEEIKTKGITDLKDLFKYDAAVDIKSEAEGSFNNYGQGDVSIRGFSGNRILMQRDSIRLPSVYRFGTAYTIYRSEMVDLNSLKSTEILKGAASALYGSDALGGVITYESLFPEDILANDEKSKIETNNSFNSSNTGLNSTIKIAGRDDDSGLEAVIVATRTNASETEIKSDDEFINDSSSNGFNIFSNFVKNINDNSRLNLIIENVDKQTDTAIKSSNLSSSYSSANEVRSVERTLVSLNYEYDNNEGEKFFDYIKLGAYIQNAYSEDDSKLTRVLGYDPGASNPLFGVPGQREYGVMYLGERQIENDYDLKDDSIGGNIQFRNDIDKLTNHRITFGVDFSTTSNERTRTKYDSGALSTVGPVAESTRTVKDSPDTDTTLIGVYLQDEISFDNNKWEIIPGVRFDYYDLDSSVDDVYLQSPKASNPIDLNESVINPSLALLYKANENLTLYGKYNGGFRAPQYSEINSTFGNMAYGYYIVSNPDLKSETSTNYEIGINGDYDKFKFGLNGFWSNFNNRIDGYEAVSNTSPYYDKGDDGLVQSSLCNPRAGIRFAEGKACDDLSVFQFVNKDSANIYGVELSSNYNFNSEPSGFTLFNSFAYTIGNDTSSSNYIPLLSINPFKAIAGIRYDSNNQKWSSELISTYTGVANTSSSNTNFVPEAHTIFDFIGSYNVNERLKLDIGIYNLNDQKYFNFSTVKNESRTSDNLDRFAEPGRHFKVGFNYKF